MGQPITGHVAHLLPEQGYAILLLDNAQEITATRECVTDGMFDRLHVGDRVWYFAEAEKGPHLKHAGMVPLFPPDTARVRGPVLRAHRW